MTAAELIAALSVFPGDMRVMVRDSIGPVDPGGPYLSEITTEDADNCGDAEDMIGETVIAIRV